MMPMSEKRATLRYRVLKRGTLAFAGGGIDRTVRNLSTSGARIDLPAPAKLPATFMLIIEADQFIRRCRSVWSDNGRLGVAFD